MKRQRCKAISYRNTLGGPHICNRMKGHKGNHSCGEISEFSRSSNQDNKSCKYQWEQRKKKTV